MILKDSDRYFTPQVVLDKIAEQWPQGITLDPCWDPESYVKAQLVYDAREDQDGLALPWTVPNPIPTPGREPWRDNVLAPRVFVNPPYSNPAPWALHAVQHTVSSADTEVIMLVNANPGSAWWAKYVWPYARVCFLGQRLKFGKLGGVKPTPSPNDSAILYYGQHHEAFRRVWGPIGTVVRPEVAVAA